MKSIVTDDMKILVTSRDAASICGVTSRLWRIWHRLGYTPMPVKIGKMHFWKHKELEAWIDAGCPKRTDWIYREKKTK
jgi:predicted DNA-binding transcriptional regulator AlpA